MFAHAAGLKMEHIAYNGNGPATTALLGGEVQVLMGSMPAVLAQIKNGEIRALAVGTVRRSPELPDVPTMQEAGIKDFEASLWLGVVAPAGTPDAIVKQLHAAILKTVKDPEVAKRLRKSGAEPVTIIAAGNGQADPGRSGEIHQARQGHRARQIGRPATIRSSPHPDGARAALAAAGHFAPMPARRAGIGVAPHHHVIVGLIQLQSQP